MHVIQLLFEHHFPGIALWYKHILQSFPHNRQRSSNFMTVIATVSFKENKIMFKALNLNPSLSSPEAPVIAIDRPWLVLVTIPSSVDLVPLWALTCIGDVPLDSHVSTILSNNGVSVNFHTFSLEDLA
jgi:hypothetical protein